MSDFFSLVFRIRVSGKGGSPGICYLVTAADLELLAPPTSLLLESLGCGLRRVEEGTQISLLLGQCSTNWATFSLLHSISFLQILMLKIWFLE